MVATNSLGTAELTHISSKVDAQLDGDLLSAEITQVYQNQTESLLDCECIFPLTDKQFLGNVEVKINGKLILEDYNGDYLILEIHPRDKVELKVTFSEVMEVAATVPELI